MASSKHVRSLTQNKSQLIHHHLKQHKQRPLIQAPHRQQQGLFPFTFNLPLVGHGLCRHMRHRAREGCGGPVWPCGQEEYPGSGGAGHPTDGVHSGEPAGAGRHRQQVTGGYGRRGDVADNVGGKAEVGEAHAEGPHHEALAADAVDEDAGVAGGGCGQLVEGYGEGGVENTDWIRLQMLAASSGIEADGSAIDLSSPWFPELYNIYLVEKDNSTG